MKSTRLLALGLLFVLTAGVLGFYTLFLTDIDIFGKASSITVHFPEARGLRQGDSVLVAGMRVGRVSELAFDPEAERDKRITVSLRLEHPLVLREDYEIASWDMEPGDILIMGDARCNLEIRPRNHTGSEKE